MLNIWRNISRYVPEFGDWINTRIHEQYLPLLSSIYSGSIKQLYLEDIVINQSEDRIGSCECI